MYDCGNTSIRVPQPRGLGVKKRVFRVFDHFRRTNARNCRIEFLIFLHQSTQRFKPKNSLRHHSEIWTLLVGEIWLRAQPPEKNRENGRKLVFGERIISMTVRRRTKLSTPSCSSRRALQECPICHITKTRPLFGHRHANISKLEKFEKSRDSDRV